MARLDRWTSEEKVRAIGVTGMGGLGKTSLIGHWLKKRGGTGKRLLKGLFYWSFYANRDVSQFLEGLTVFAEKELGRPSLQDAETLAEQAVCHVHEAALLVVLDGLDVM